MLVEVSLTDSSSEGSGRDASPSEVPVLAALDEDEGGSLPRVWRPGIPCMFNGHAKMVRSVARLYAHSPSCEALLVVLRRPTLWGPENEAVSAAKSDVAASVVLF